MIILIVWILFLVATIWVGSARKLSGGMMVISIVASLLVPVLGLILAAVLPANKPDLGGGGGGMAELEKAQSLLERGAITREEFDKVKARTLGS